jgi:hypothetical protein
MSVALQAENIPPCQRMWYCLIFLVSGLSHMLASRVEALAETGGGLVGSVLMFGE